MSWAPANSVSSSEDFVDSAESGRNAAWSFSVTLLSLPDKRAGDRREDEQAEHDDDRRRDDPLPVDLPASRLRGAVVVELVSWSCRAQQASGCAGAATPRTPARG